MRPSQLEIPSLVSCGQFTHTACSPTSVSCCGKTLHNHYITSNIGQLTHLTPANIQMCELFTMSPDELKCFVIHLREGERERGRGGGGEGSNEVSLIHSGGLPHLQTVLQHKRAQVTAVAECFDALHRQ